MNIYCRNVKKKKKIEAVLLYEIIFIKPSFMSFCSPFIGWVCYLTYMKHIVNLYSRGDINTNSFIILLAINESMKLESRSSNCIDEFYILKTYSKSYLCCKASHENNQAGFKGKNISNKNPIVNNLEYCITDISLSKSGLKLEGENINK